MAGRGGLGRGPVRGPAQRLHHGPRRCSATIRRASVTVIVKAKPGKAARLASLWTAPQRWWQAYSKAPRAQLQVMVHSVEAGCGLHLYIRN
jgi:hypothetical protein